MIFNIAATLAFALVATNNMGVRAEATEVVPEFVNELNIVDMECMGEPGGYKGKCMREDGGIWGCEEGLICVLKNFKVGKCLKPEDPVPTDSDMWVKKGKGITCASRIEETPLGDTNGKNPDEGQNCSAEDTAKGCACAGARWRCADACDMTAKACDKGFKCLRLTNFAYAICANEQILEDRGITERYDPATMAQGIPCGEDIGKYQVPEDQWFIPGPLKGKHADRCAEQEAEHAAHGHGDGHDTAAPTPASADHGDHSKDHSTAKAPGPAPSPTVEDDVTDDVPSEAPDEAPAQAPEGDLFVEENDHDHSDGHEAHGGLKMLGEFSEYNTSEKKKEAFVVVSYMREILDETDMWFDEEPEWHQEMVAQMKAGTH